MRLTKQHILKGFLFAAGLLIILLLAYAHACARADRVCPRCGSAKVCPIIYGLPRVIVGERARTRPLIATPDEIGYLQGGCITGTLDRYCRSCGLMWRRWHPWEREQGPRWGLSTGHN